MSGEIRTDIFTLLTLLICIKVTTNENLLYSSENSTQCSARMLSHFSSVRLFATLSTVAHQAPLAMGFSRQEYWSGLPCPPPGHLPDPEIEPTFFMSPTLSGRFFTTSTTWEALRALWWPKWEGNLKKKGYMYLYRWLTLLYSRN